MVRQIFSESDLRAPRILCRDGVVTERITIDKNHYVETWTEAEWARMLVECHSPPVFFDHKKFYCKECPNNGKKLMQKHRLNNHRQLVHDGLKFYPTALEQNWPNRLVGRDRVTASVLIEEWWTKHPDGQPLDTTPKKEVKREPVVEADDDDDFEEVTLRRSGKSRDKARRKPQRVLQLDKGDESGAAGQPEPARPVIRPRPPRLCEPTTPSPPGFRTSLRDAPPDISTLQIGTEGARKGEEDPAVSVLREDQAGGRDGRGRGGAGMAGEQGRVQTLRDSSPSGSRRAAEAGDIANDKKRELPSDKDSESEKKRKVDSRMRGTESSYQGDAMVADDNVSEPSGEFPGEEEAVAERERLRLQREEVLLRFQQAAETEIPEENLSPPPTLPRTGLAILLMDCGLMSDETGSWTTWTAEEMLQKVSAFQNRESSEDALCQCEGKFNRLKRQVNN